ncbi:zebrafish testis-expressed 38 isoform X2 [Melanotaenia boesemani]|uniref:zebrafish testis-expressed 38 isoform X2 n=1 Tax=Melanotaenia boesemani TaxID=1250792 RepID=UPI001C04966C|nr:zebrafish testis-expressed 38 isoform X2 [Melanotaenia boesemani]
MAAGKICIGGSKEETVEWTGLFPTDLKSEQDSLVFVKRLMAVAVSSITYLRGIFPEYAYRSRYLEDLCIKILHGNCNSPGANKVVKWMMGCFDALEKQYVYTNPEDPNRIIESYRFSFRYTEKGPEMDILRNNDMELQVTPEETKRASVLLIRKLFLLMQNLDSLPNNVYLTMKLYYYDEITPWDYQPPGFKEGVCDHLWFEGMPVHFKVGEVRTAFHSLKVKVSMEQSHVDKLQKGIYLRETEQVPTERGMMENPPKKMCAEEDLPSEDESAQFKKPTKALAKRKAATKNLKRKKKRI